MVDGRGPRSVVASVGRGLSAGIVRVGHDRATLINREAQINWSRTSQVFPGAGVDLDPFTHIDEQRDLQHEARLERGRLARA